MTERHEHQWTVVETEIADNGEPARARIKCKCGASDIIEDDPSAGPALYASARTIRIGSVAVAGILAEQHPGDAYIDHAKLQQRYLVHYDAKMGPRFGIDVWSNQRQAEQDADGYRADGFAARVLVVTVEDGEPVARWAD